MEILIIKNESNLELTIGANSIESYQFDQPITLTGLFDYLLNDEFCSDFTIILKNEELMTDSDKELIKLIKELLIDYGNKKLEFEQFLKSQSNMP